MCQYKTVFFGFNTQPRGGGCHSVSYIMMVLNSFNTQPRGGGCHASHITLSGEMGFNTQPRGGGCFLAWASIGAFGEFQHTAARRRLQTALLDARLRLRFNTQPRGGGCKLSLTVRLSLIAFQHTAARRRLPFDNYIPPINVEVSTHSRAEAAALQKFSRAWRAGGFNTQPRGGGCSRS